MLKNRTIRTMIRCAFIETQLSFGSSFSGLCSSSSLSSGGGSLGSSLGLLGSESLSLGVLNSNLSVSSFLHLLGSLGSKTRNLGRDLSLLSLRPSLKLGLSLLSGESTLLHTSIEMLHQENTLVGENAASSQCGLCTSLHPVEGAFEIEMNSSRVGVGIVSTDLLNILTITWRSAICDYDAINCVVLVTMSCKTDLCSHFAN